MSLQAEVDILFAHAMKGEWREVLKIYKRSPEARKAKLTKSEDTALHIAVTVGQTENAVSLVEIVSKDQPEILEIADAKGDTALHIAAALGDLSVCKSMASKSLGLVTARNHKGETPLFLAALHGKKEAFLFLCSLGGRDDFHVRRNDGDTILHAAIIGEYFSLAMIIIHCHPELADAMNENGLSPLHILARKPNAFRSSCRLGLFDRIIYHCLVLPADDLKEEVDDIDDIDAYIEKRSKKTTEVHNYPANYKTMVAFFRMLLLKEKKNDDGNNNNDEENPELKSSSAQVGITSYASSSAASLESKSATQGLSLSIDKGKQAQVIQNKTSTEENPKYKNNNSSQGKNHLQSQRSIARYFPPNYNTLVLFVNLMIKASLIILRIGISRIDEIRRKKRLHKWAKLVMSELVMNTTSYKFGDSAGSDPFRTRAGKAEESFGLDEIFELPFVDPTYIFRGNKQLTPILIAAKMGVTEMVEKILKEFPVAIQDLDNDGKNVVLLAVENRHPQIYNLLLNSNIPKESMFRQVDKDGNSALHLAAQCPENRSSLILGVALQMQREIKWYKFVKYSMPLHFFPRYNNAHQTPEEIFSATHMNLSKGGGWLVKTAESCSVVAALVITVSYATSAAIPGGVNQVTGLPLLMDRPAFRAFALSSLAALGFSITSLVFFLSILTSPYHEKDFDPDLPHKLLLGLTSLFASITAMLVSFCAGHLFILPDNLRLAAYPLYAAMCFPITQFALAQLSLYFDLFRGYLQDFTPS